jgi:hypothetical protein
MKRQNKNKRILNRVGHEMKKRVPRNLKRQIRKKGKRGAESMRKAILLSKARKEGADV